LVTFAKPFAVERAPRLVARWAASREDPQPELWLVPVLCKPGKVTVDVGAHYGTFTLFALPCSARCYAFEPVPIVAAKLKRSFSRCPNVVVEQVALSDRDGAATLRVAINALGRSTLEPHNQLRDVLEVQTMEVPVRRLDGYRISQLGLIKIDVEGHEEAVLAGAAETLERDRPNVLVEAEERHNPGAVGRLLSFFARRGYHGWFLCGADIRPIAEFDLGKHQNPANISGGTRIGLYVNNFVFSADEANAARLAAALRSKQRQISRPQTGWAATSMAELWPAARDPAAGGAPARAEAGA
jgi:FkbM family methyltransferase